MAQAFVVDAVADAGRNVPLDRNFEGGQRLCRMHQRLHWNEVVRIAVDVSSRRVPVIAGAGSNSTAHTVELAKAAETAGADAILSVVPYYNKPPQAGLLNHFTYVADATGLPVMLYDIPGRSGVPIRTETLQRLAEHERVVAVKDAKGDFYETTRVLATTDLAYYCGEDALNLPMLALGAVGVVSVVSHACADSYAAMVRAVDAGDLDEARRLNKAVLPAVRGIMTRSQGAIMAKAALQLLGVLSNRTTRPPLVDATDDELALLRTDLAEAGLLS